MMAIQLLLEWDGMSGDVIFVFPRRKKITEREKKSERLQKIRPCLPEQTGRIQGVQDH